MSILKVKNGNTWIEIPAGGQGVPSGGTTGQFLRKSSSTDYATEWSDDTGGVTSVNGMTGDVTISTIAVQDSTPVGGELVWIDTDEPGESITIPQIDDSNVSSNDTWSSQKISNEISSVSSSGGAMYFPSQTVNVATNAEIFRITSAAITTQTVLVECTFASPQYITSDVTWTTYDGYIAFYSTCTAATTANVTLSNVETPSPTVPLAVANGGTGATTAANARTNLDVVCKSGDIMTGNLYVAKAGNAYVQAENENTGAKLNLDTGAGANHGIWTYGYYDGSSFHSDAKWMIYRDDSGNVIVNGSATDNVLKSGGTMTGNLAVEKDSEVNIWASNTKSGQVHKISLCAGASGRGGIYDSTHGKWLVDYDINGNCRVNNERIGPAVQLSTTYTSNTLVTSTAFARLHPFDKNGFLFLVGNMLVSSGAATSDFTEIGRITSWSAIDAFYATVPPQTTNQPIISVQITADGIIRLYRGSAATSESWYRFTATMPQS